MKTRLIVLCLVLAMCLCGCSSPSSLVEDIVDNTEGGSILDKVEDVEAIVDKIETAVFGSYEEVLEEYSKKLREATPILIEEYKEAAKNNQDGLNGLAALCNEKVSELAVISNEGIEEMATLYFTKGSGSYEDYMDWAGKLQEVYMEEAAKIQEVYMDSAM